MGHETQATLNTLLMLLGTLIQFLLRIGPQDKRMSELEHRVEKIEERLQDAQESPSPR